MITPPNTSRRCGFTLVELLVVIAIIGTLIALFLPAVQSAREAARRIECNNHLKQIGLAIQNYHDTNGQFPNGRTATDEFSLAWSYSILPQLEQQAVYDAYDPSFPVHAEENAGAMRVGLPVYVCPSRRSAGADRDFDNNGEGGGANGEPRRSAVRGDYAANAGLEEDMGMEQNDYAEGQGNEDEPIDFVGWHNDLSLSGPIFSNSDISARRVTDGLSKTLAVGERHIPPLEGDWSDEQRDSGRADTCFLSGDNLRVVMRGTEDGLATGPDAHPVSPEQSGWRRRGTQVFGGEHPGVVMFVFLDGHTEALSIGRTGFAAVNPNGIRDVPNPSEPNDLDEIEQWGWFMALSTVAGSEIVSD